MLSKTVFKRVLTIMDDMNLRFREPADEDEAPQTMEEGKAAVASMRDACSKCLELSLLLYLDDDNLWVQKILAVALCAIPTV